MKTLSLLALLLITFPAWTQDDGDDQTSTAPDTTASEPAPDTYEPNPVMRLEECSSEYECARSYNPPSDP